MPNPNAIVDTIARVEPPLDKPPAGSGLLHGPLCRRPAIQPSTRRARSTPFALRSIK